MWIRTINGVEFIEVEFTSQGFPIIKTKQSGGGMATSTPRSRSNRYGSNPLWGQ
jgi:hypothetical protein